MFYLAEDVASEFPGNRSFANMGAEREKEFWATLALRHCPGLGARGAASLLRQYGSALATIENYRGWTLRGNVAARSYADGKWRDGAKREWDQAKKSRAQILLWIDPDYPPLLRQIPDAPLLLYFQGDASLLASTTIAIVGSRKASATGLEISTDLAASLSASGITIVSGMATGIDRRAHIAALEHMGKSIGVLGAGIEIRYPASNRDLYARMQEEGLLVSEFAPKIAPLAHNFPIRNRIISGLSLGTVVVEAAERSGSLVTARQALEQNREVFAVPGVAMTSQSLGCQNLVRQGAHPVFCVDDILREFVDILKPDQIQRRQNRNAPMTKETGANDESAGMDAETAGIAAKLAPEDISTKIVDFLAREGSAHSDAIAEYLGIGIDKLSSQLLVMEITGRVRQVPGGRFEILK